MIVRWLIRICAALATFASGLLIDEVDTKLLSGRNITEKTGMACAYADFNQDRLTDILHYRHGKLYVLLQQQRDFTNDNFTDTQNLIIDLQGDFAEVACSVGDINYDGYHDVVVSMRKNKGEGDWNVKYFYYKMDEKKKNPRFVQGEKVELTKYQVALIDVTGDGVHDLIGVRPDDTIICLSGDKAENKVFTVSCDLIFVDYSGVIHPLMPILFGDIDNDRFAEMIFMKYDKQKGIWPEIWSRDDYLWRKKKELQLPQLPAGVSFAHTLAPLLADIDLNARMDLIVPVCRNATCVTLDNLQVIEWDKNAGNWTGWKTVPIDLAESSIFPEEDTLVRLKVGDINLDGYPDMLVTIGDMKGGNNYAAVIENKQNDVGSGRKFQKQTQMMIMPGLALGMIQSSSFFDFLEDGYLDVLVQWKLKAGDWQWSLCFTEPKEQGDVTFLKVQTFMPLPDTIDIKDGLGVVWGGVCVTYEMETTGIGETRRAIECQLPGNSHKAGLSPPFALFGLGRNPNFIDSAVISVPRSGNEPNRMSHTQKQIVPNARMMVQPPALDHYNWVLRLYLTPSSLIYSSLIVMASTCSILLIVVLILHLREKKVDRVERAAQSHRFHFDAM